ncbi:MAG: citrate/2-methylcitrate synthase [Candidatus Methanoperedens sp.]|nr:citrate/2-methylcitrate synthase [Candidatus Methanoperedens sp.]
MHEVKNIGLRGVEIADTRISEVDGERGKLIYRGYDIEDLAKNSNFEETIYLLLYDTLPTGKELAVFREVLASHRELPRGIIKHLERRKKTAHPMDVLQSTVSMLPDFDRDARTETRAANIEKSINLTAKMATLVAYWDRIRKNLDIKEPDKELGHAANFLYMLKGEPQDADIARDFEVSLILHAEHSFNPSTFAAREVASTRAHMYACIGAALAALSGGLHGGVNTLVMKMLLEIDSTDRVEEWVKSKLEEGERIMGMGHAVYKSGDPRVRILSDISKRLAERSGNMKWYELSRMIENVARDEFRRHKGKEIYPNVDFYSASIYYMMGIEPDLFTPVFALARTPGWCAHVIEEKFAEAAPGPVLYRPSAGYTGRYCGREVCRYVPIGERK